MRNFALVGIGLVIIVFGLVLIVVPYLTVLGSTMWLNETFSVPQFNYYYYYGTFRSKVTLHITFEVVSGGDRILDFRVIDEANFQKMSANEPFEYYPRPSRESISQMELDWVPPSEERIYFMWDNTRGFESKLVSANFSYRTSVSIYTYLGVLLLFGGLATSGYGNNQPAPSSSRKSIVLGYFLATLGGLIGLIIGITLARRENPEDKLHGKIILVLGVFATIAYILLLLLS